MTLSERQTRMLPLRPTRRLPALWRRAHTGKARPQHDPGAGSSLLAYRSRKGGWWVAPWPPPGVTVGANWWVPPGCKGWPEPRARAAVLVAALGGMCACDCDATRAARWRRRRGGHWHVCTWSLENFPTEYTE